MKARYFNHDRTSVLDVLSKNPDGTVNLGANGKLIVGKVKIEEKVGSCVLIEEPKPEVNPEPAKKGK